MVHYYYKGLPSIRQELTLFNEGIQLKNVYYPLQGMQEYGKSIKYQLFMVRLQNLQCCLEVKITATSVQLLYVYSMSWLYESL